MKNAAVLVALLLQAVCPSTAAVARERPFRPLATLHPPFKVVWDYDSGKQAFSRVVSGHTAFLAAWEYFESVDLRTGRRLWRRPLKSGEPGCDLAFDGRVLWVTIGSGHLLACDSRTGRTLWSLSRKGYAGPIGTAPGSVYTEINDGVLSAIDSRLRRVLWSVNLEPKPRAKDDHRNLGVSCTPVVAGNDVYVGACDGRILRLDARTGAVRWAIPAGKPSKGSAYSIAVRGNRVFCCLGDGRLIALNASNGKVLWELPSETEGAVAPAYCGFRILYNAGDGSLRAVNATNGRLVWRRNVGESSSYSPSAPIVYKGQVLCLGGRYVWAFSLTGRNLWKWHPTVGRNDFLVAAADRSIVLGDSFALTRFNRGTVSLPTSRRLRRALAAKLAKHMGRLSCVEEERFKALGEDAFQALVPVVRKAIKTSNGSRDRFAGMLAFDRSVQRLLEVATRRDTRVVLELLRRCEGPGGGGPFIEWLSRHGDTRLAIPDLVDIVKAKSADWGATGYAAPMALEGIEGSSDPRAVAFLIKQLGDSHAPDQLRHSAFVHLAGVGGAAGLHAVLAARERNVVVLTRPGAAESASSSAGDAVTLTETERALAAALEGKHRFESQGREPYEVVLPRGVNRLVLRTSDKVSVGGEQVDPYDFPTRILFSLPNSGFHGETVRGHRNDEYILWNADHTAAKVQLNFYSGQMGTIGYDVCVKRFGNEWLTIGERMAWIS